MPLEQHIKSAIEAATAQLSGQFQERLQSLASELSEAASAEHAREVEDALARAKEGLASQQEAALEALREDLAAQHAAALEAQRAELAAQHDAAIAALRAEADEQRELAVSMARSEASEHQEAAVAAARAEADSRQQLAIEALRADLAVEHAAALDAVRAQLVSGREADLEALRAELVAERETAVAAALEALRSDLAAQHDTSLEAARVEAELRQESALAALGTELSAQHEAELEALRAELVSRHDEAVAGIRAQLTAEHDAAFAAALAASLAEKTQRHDAALTQAAQEHEAALAQAVQEHEAALAQTAQRHEAALAAIRSEADDRIARARAEADELLAHARAEADERLAAAKAEADASLAASVAEARAAVVQDTGQELVDARAAERQTELAFAERLSDAVRRLDNARSLIEVLDVLVDTSAREVPRVAVFLVRGSKLAGWRAAGFSRDKDPRELEVPLDQAGLLTRAVRSSAPVTASDAVSGDTGVTPFGALPVASAAVAVPLRVGGETVGVLYADDVSPRERETPSAWPESIEVLSRHACRCLEVVTIARVTQPVSIPAPSAPTPRRHTPQTRGFQPGHDDDDDAARRYARLLVSEIKLYHESAVTAGRRDRNLAERLRTEIERARRLYGERVPAAVLARTDYFDQELVRTLANGDASLLGPA